MTENERIGSALIRQPSHMRRKPVDGGLGVTIETEMSPATSQETVKLSMRIRHQGIKWTECAMIGSVAGRF